MKTGITYEIQDYLANQTELLELVSGKYVRKGSGELFEANLKHLFPGDQEMAKLINPGSYIGGIVYNHIASYVGQPKEKQKINYIDLWEGMLSTGYIRFFQNVDDEVLETVKANKYYYDENKSIEYFVNIYEKDKENITNFSKYYLLVETFSKNIFERKLFELNSVNNLSDGTQIPLDTLEFLKGKLEKVRIDNIDRLVIEKQIERPLLEKLKTIIFSIEKKLAEIDKNFLDYTEQFKVFRNIEVPDDAYKELSNGIKVVDFDKLGKIIQVNELNGSQGGLDIVRNTNDLLVQSIEYIDKQIRSISAITGIPLFAFGIKVDGGQDSGTSKEKSAGIFYKKIETYRDAITSLFLDFFERFKVSEDERLLEFGEIVTSDMSEIVDIQKSLLDMGIQSKKRAIMKVHNTDEKEAEKILKEIQNELSLINTEGDKSKLQDQAGKR